MKNYNKMMPITAGQLREQLKGIREKIGLTRYFVSQKTGIRIEAIKRLEENGAGSADAALKVIAYYINAGLLRWDKLI